MGAVLIRSAHSPNIKERRDCSTALFEPGGELVMQAEHIPVHLGSMPDAVAAILDEEQRPGESWILNDPFRGGTHLPDITLITPVFCGTVPRGLRRQPRAPRRRRRADAGLDARQLTLARGGGRRDLPDAASTIGPSSKEITAGMRNRPQRVADLRAQWAANDLGAARAWAN